MRSIVPLKNVIGELLGVFREAHIVAAETIAPRFRKITLSGASLRAHAFTPGDKVRVVLDAGPRTYTPAFDAEGRATLLVYVHAETPGALFGSNAKADDRVTLFGPHGAQDFTKLRGPAVFFGDETSIAAATLYAQHHGKEPYTILEATDLASTEAACDAMGLRPNKIIVRGPQGEHLDEVATAVRVALENRAALVMTGKAQSIQAIQRHLSQAGVRPQQRSIKAFWSVGRRGLD